jgi:hypothetical protein
MAKAEQAKILAVQSLTPSNTDFSTSQRSLGLSWASPERLSAHAAEGVAQVRQD